MGWYRERYRRFLIANYPPAGAVADLCAYFYRRAFDSLRPGGHLGMVASNAIRQGDTRVGGLAAIRQKGGTITFALRFIKWPGAVNVEAILIAIRTGHWAHRCELDGKPVTSISSRLDAEPAAEPRMLRSNAGRAFQGSIPLSTGFLLDPEEARSLITRNPRNRECLLPYLTGEDLNTRPDQSPSRWIIQFGERSEAEARTFPDPWTIAQERVWPERRGKDATKYARMVREWRKHWNNRQALYEAARSLRRVLVRSRVSELPMLAFEPPDMIFGDAVVVFAFDDDYRFALVQSNAHEAWVRRNASTMRTDIRYTPTDCFDNFPFPQEPLAANRRWAGLIRETYHEHRRQVMLARSLGLTKTYNLFQNERCRDQDVVRLPDLHAELDRAFLACCRWEDLEPGHGFHVNERGQVRFTISPAARRELLRRLLDLDLQIAADVAANTSQSPKR